VASTSAPTIKDRIDGFFEISKRGSTFGGEVRGGLVTFVAMAYIVVLNPIILSGGVDIDGNSLDFAQLSAVTALTAGVMTILFGLVARLPFAFAAGLGINSFLAFSVVGQVTWAEAMGLVVINGLFIVLLASVSASSSHSSVWSTPDSSRRPVRHHPRSVSASADRSPQCQHSSL
jgi:AGZA family xanthine/uracil permease-like MFS transporter